MRRTAVKVRRSPRTGARLLSSGAGKASNQRCTQYALASSPGCRCLPGNEGMLAVGKVCRRRNVGMPVGWREM